MRLSTQSVTSDIVSRLQQLSAQTNELHKRASTGRKVELASDDAALMNRIMVNQSEKRDLQQFRRTQNYAEAVTTKTYSVLDRLQEMTNRAQEVSMIGGSVVDDDHFIAYSEEIDELIKEAVRLGNSTHLGQSLFAGTNTGDEPFAATFTAGEISAVAYDGNTTDAEVAIGQGAKIKPRLEAAQNPNIKAFIDDMIILRDELKAGNNAGVATLQHNFMTAEDNMVRALGSVSATMARIETQRTFDDEQYQQITQTMAAETEVDLPSTLVQLTQSQTAYQAAMRGAVSVLNMSLLDYL